MGRRRADAFSQISIQQEIESKEVVKSERLETEVLMSLHQTIVTMLDRDGNQIAFWAPSNIDEHYGVRSIGGDFIIKNTLCSEDHPRWQVQISTVFEIGESTHGEYPLYFPIGEFWFDISFSPVWGPKGTVTAVLVMLRDITLLKDKVNELLSMYRDLHLYTSLLRHDLSNDVQVILTETEVSQIKDSDETDLKQMRDTVKASAERMVRVIKAFKEHGGEKGHNILQLLRNATRQGEVIHQNLKIVVRATPESQDVVVSGGRLLPMVFDNLIRNVAKHAGRNPELDIILSLKGREAQIDFRDNGPGISLNLQKTLFEKRNGQHGLSLCKRIIEGCGGTIILLTRLNGFTTFRINLPLVR